MVQVVFKGQPLTLLKLTVPLNPLSGVTVMVLVPDPPCMTVTLEGFDDKLKFGDGGAARALINAAPFGLPQPVARS